MSPLLLPDAMIFLSSPEKKSLEPLCVSTLQRMELRHRVHCSYSSEKGGKAQGGFCGSQQTGAQPALEPLTHILVTVLLAGSAGCDSHPDNIWRQVWLSDYRKEPGNLPDGSHSRDLLTLISGEHGFQPFLQKLQAIKCQGIVVENPCLS